MRCSAAGSTTKMRPTRDRRRLRDEEALDTAPPVIAPPRGPNRERGGWYNPPAPARWCTASHAVRCKGFMRKAQSINADREKNQSTGHSSSLTSPESASKRFQKRERSACFPSVDLGRWAAAVEPPKMGPEGLQEVTIDGRRSIAPIAPRAQGLARSVARSIERKLEHITGSRNFLSEI